MNQDELEEKMKTLWEKASHKTKTEDKEAGWNRFSKMAYPNVQKSYKQLIQYAAMAVILLGIAGMSWFAISNESLEKGMLDQYVVIANPSDVSKIVYLPDSTRIELSSKSQLSYASNFTVNRSVHLQGEAFFKVTKDAQFPFRVKCNTSTTTVLGTSFIVKSLLDKGVNVQLYEGKVQMELDHEEKRWQLAPGEQFSFQENEVSIDTFAVDQDFDQVRLSEVFRFLEEKRGYLVKTNEALNNKVVTLRIGKRDDIKDIATLIATLYDQRVEIDDATHTILFYNQEKSLTNPK